MEKKILLVEDEKPLSKAIETSLVSNGFSVESVVTRDGAILALNKYDISGVWLDHYLLGEGTGLDVLAALKENKSWKDIPVFVVTNSAGDDKVRKYELFGVEKYYIKSNTKLNDIVKDVCEVCR